METKEIKIRFIVDNLHSSLEYTPMELLNKSEEDIIHDMETCSCSLNEANPHCEGDCIKYENSHITGYVIDPDQSKLSQDEIEKLMPDTSINDALVNIAENSVELPRFHINEQLVIKDGFKAGAKWMRHHLSTKCAELNAVNVHTDDRKKDKAVSFANWIQSDYCEYMFMQGFGKAAWISDLKYDSDHDSEIDRENLINKYGISTQELYDVYAQSLNKK